MTHGRLLQQDTAESNCLWCAKALVRRVAGGYCRLQGPALRQEGGGFSRCERILKHPQLRQDSPQAPAVPSPGPGRARTVVWRRLPGRGGRRRGRDARRWRHHDCSVGRSGRHSIGPQCAESDDLVASVYRFCRELSCQRKWARRRSRTWCGRPTTRRGCGSAAARGAAGGQPVKASSPRPSLSRPTVPPHRASATTTAETMGTTRWMRSECTLDTVQLPWLPVSPTSAGLVVSCFLYPSSSCCNDETRARVAQDHRRRELGCFCLGEESNASLFMMIMTRKNDANQGLLIEFLENFKFEFFY